MNTIPLRSLTPCGRTRREFLWRFGGGLGGIALSCLLAEQQSLADQPQPRAEFTGGLHHRAKAKRVVQLFMSGAASQCDTFDYKPELIKRTGEKFDPGGKVELFQSDPGAVMKSHPWTPTHLAQQFARANTVPMIAATRSDQKDIDPLPMLKHHDYAVIGMLPSGKVQLYNCHELSDTNQFKNPALTMAEFQKACLMVVLKP